MKDYNTMSIGQASLVVRVFDPQCRGSGFNYFNLFNC